MSSAQMLQDAQKLQQAGRLPEAARAYSELLRQEPANFQALYQLGMILFQYGQYPEADRFLGAATRLNSSSAELFYNRGCTLQHLGRNEEALAAFARALALAPDFSQARNNRGVTLLATGRPQEALTCFEGVLARHPEFAAVHNNRATALIALRHFGPALQAADTALRIQPDFPDARFNRGSALAALGQRHEALAAFDETLAIAPQHADALTYRGILLEILGRPAEALDCYNTALGARPGNAEILFNRTSALRALGRFEEIVADCDQLLAANPHFKYAQGQRLYAKLHCCDWIHLPEELAAALAEQRAGHSVFQPLQAITVLDSEEDLLACSRLWIANEFPASTPLWNGERYRHNRIRVAYVSADFGFHPAMLLAAGVFENHDRGKFEVTAISTGPADGSDMRRRLENAFEQFIDVSDRNPLEIAELIRERETDIAVDLMGHTQNAPTAVFAHRPAPLQVSYLGFAGTTGAPYMDYLIADHAVVEPSRAHFYSEKIAWLPQTCMPNDRTRRIGPAPNRSAAGLPDSAFVFCNFGKAQKITPEVFACWMRLLAQTADAVLWLAQTNGAAERNLTREAERHGVSAHRVIFAPFVDRPEEHLGRISLADLFLDTCPYNAHATACDFLWAGVPVVTLAGGSFAGRVGASALSAAGLPQLIAHSLAEYELLALKLAQSPSALRELKSRLAESRANSVLFDTLRYTRDLEQAYLAMHSCHRSGDPPHSFAVEPAAVQ